MRLQRVDVRFYKSFNYDYERKARRDLQPEAWEDATEGWFPFVRVNIDPKVTAILGANESGKSQLLSGVKAAIGGQDIHRSDFCRYSHFYSVQSGAMRIPEFGAVFRIETDADLAVIASLDSQAKLGDDFALYRPGRAAAFALFASARVVDLSAAQLASIEAILPVCFALKTDRAIPDTMSIAALAGRSLGPMASRRRRGRLLKTLGAGSWAAAAEFGASVFPSWASIAQEEATEDEQRRSDEFELGRQLLVDVAHIDTAAFAELADALEKEQEGPVEGVIGAMNAALAQNLNFQRWWTQDKDFDLRLEAREHEVAFTIRDRTNAKYSFDERSQGLRFFLSYFVQLAAHRPQASSPEILLLDEPDAYLSSSGQQDLLRVLEDYATPEGGGQQNQVIYVTHSPFLINRNAGTRIRVLDKGVQDEGTRVVRDATKNHYEPLRSALGTYIAETAFIGGANLFVEGVADQVFLVGISSYLGSVHGNHVDYLDLNEVTIVPSGSAQSIPYMVYLARGRDQIKSACAALLDGDKEGKIALELLRQRQIRGKRVLNDRYILCLDEWATAAGIQHTTGVIVREIEDLVPLSMLVAAARVHAIKISGVAQSDVKSLSEKMIRDALNDCHGSSWDALSQAYKDAFPEAHMEKVGLAKEVVGLLEASKAKPSRMDGQPALEENFSLLLRELAGILHDATIEEEERRSDRRLDRAIDGFVRDHSKGIGRYRAGMLLRELEQALTDSDHADSRRVDIIGIRREFQLDRETGRQVAPFLEFRRRIQELRYADRIEDQLAADETVSAADETGGATARESPRRSRTPRRRSASSESDQPGP